MFRVLVRFSGGTGEPSATCFLRLTIPNYKDDDDDEDEED
jgi:hypothetical protein